MLNFQKIPNKHDFEKYHLKVQHYTVATYVLAILSS